jgi:cardiolipin synthase (CMP-forming)
LHRLPDVITLIRLLAAPVLAWLILQARFREALALVVLAGLTDWLDGFAARRFGTSGRLGVVLDPLADKVLLVTLFLVLTVVRLIPRWLLILVLARDAVIVTGALVLRALRGRHQFLPSMLGKISTFFQIMLVLMVLLWAVLPIELFYLLKSAAIVLTTLFTSLSGIDYVRRGWVMATNPAREPTKN